MIQVDTTHQHYEKYAWMARACSLTLKDTRIHWIVRAVRRIRNIDHDITGRELIVLLNRRTSLHHYDWLYPYHARKPGGPQSLADNVCMYKHLIMYESLNAESVFTDKGE